jgi:hypothetical protein
LFCEDVGYLSCKIANGNDRARRFFGVKGDALLRLDDAKRTMERRIRSEADHIRSIDALVSFIDSRANALLLTAPRNMRVTEPDQDLNRLYDELVGGRAHDERVQRRGRGISARPALNRLLSDPEIARRVSRDIEVRPLHGRAFTAEFAFFNGKSTIVKPQVIHVDPDITLQEAEQLATRGRQLSKHGLDDRAAQLIVPLPDPESRFQEAMAQVAALLNDSDVRTIYARDLPELGDEIRAHAIPVRR